MNCLFILLPIIFSGITCTLFNFKIALYTTNTLFFYHIDYRYFILISLVHDYFYKSYQFLCIHHFKSLVIYLSGFYFRLKKVFIHGYKSIYSSDSFIILFYYFIIIQSGIYLVLALFLFQMTG